MSGSQSVRRMASYEHVRRTGLTDIKNATYRPLSVLSCTIVGARESLADVIQRITGMDPFPRCHHVMIREVGTDE